MSTEARVFAAELANQQLTKENEEFIVFPRTACANIAQSDSHVPNNLVVNDQNDVWQRRAASTHRKDVVIDQRRQIFAKATDFQKGRELNFKSRQQKKQ